MSSPADIFVIDETSQKTNHLLVIGIDDYVHCNKLQTAVSDAQAFRNVLLELYNFKKEHLYELYNQEATESAMHDVLAQLIGELTEEDNLIVYYAGHGEFNSQLDLGYWVPVEANPSSPSQLFSNDTLTRYLKNLNIHHLLLFSDSCFSGSLFGGTREATYNNRKDSYASRWAFCSGMNELVVDGVDGMSPFAKYLILALQRHEGEIRVSELIEQVSELVVEDTKQTPVGGPIRDWGDSQGQFIFRLGNADEADELAWQEALKVDTHLAYDDYLDDFPQGKYKQEAEGKLYEVELEDAWAATCKVHTVSEYRMFTDKYPESPYAKEADVKRKALKEEQRGKSSVEIVDSTKKTKAKNTKKTTKSKK